MGNPYWPLFGLRVRTPRVELRPGTDDDLVELAAVARQGIHDPGYMPFLTPWSLRPEIERSVLQWHWRQRAEWKPESWHLDFVVVAGGRVVGTQGMAGKDFPVTRAVHSGSWLGRSHQGQGLGKEMRAAMLHFAFAGLDAEVATSGAFTDNVRSLAVSRSLGYEDDGVNIVNRQGTAVREIRFRLEREAWEKSARPEVEIGGLEPCLPLFGLSG